MTSLKFGVTQVHPCSYLDNENEQLIVLMPPTEGIHKNHYEWLIASGFRRSGEQVYRPHCENCKACRSVRIKVNDFVPSRSQKRLLKRINQWQIGFVGQLKEEHYALYNKYIEQRHADGPMFPPLRQQLEQFVHAEWIKPLFLEARIDGKLAAVAVTDNFRNAYSALYTFFDPEFSHLSLGNSMILAQIQQAIAHNKTYVYLGYYVQNCQKMAYKDRFLPQEQFIDGKWQLIAKKS